MPHTPTKTLSQRLEEAVNIRCQLTTLGAFLNPDNKDLYKRHSNAFIRNETSSQFALRVSNTAVAIVSLCASENAKSGIRLEA